MPFCSHCGKEIEPKVYFCCYCGAKIREKSFNRVASLLGKVQEQIDEKKNEQIERQRINKAAKEENKKAKQAEIEEQNKKRELMLEKILIIKEHMYEWKRLNNQVREKKERVEHAENKLDSLFFKEKNQKNYDSLVKELDELHNMLEDVEKRYFMHEIPVQYRNENDIDAIYKFSKKNKYYSLESAIESYTEMKRKIQSDRDKRKYEKQLEKKQRSALAEERKYQDYREQLDEDDAWAEASWLPGVKTINAARKVCDVIDNTDKYLDPIYMKAKRDHYKEKSILFDYSEDDTFVQSAMKAVGNNAFKGLGSVNKTAIRSIKKVYEDE